VPVPLFVALPVNGDEPEAPNAFPGVLVDAAVEPKAPPPVVLKRLPPLPKAGLLVCPKPAPVLVLPNPPPVCPNPPPPPNALPAVAVVPPKRLVPALVAAAPKAGFGCPKGDEVLFCPKPE
jgi:hypothetical protein